MKKGAPFFLFILLALGVAFLLTTNLSGSEQQHSGDNCRGCHGNRYTQRVVITDTTVPTTIGMGKNATVEITVMDDCRHQGSVFTGRYSELDEGTNLWLDSENDLVTDNRNGNPATIPYIESQEEKTASWTISGGYDYAAGELVVEGVRVAGEELTFTATVRNSGAGNEKLTIHIEGHNSHENELQITDDEYDIVVENTTVNATVSFLVDDVVINTTKITLGAGEKIRLKANWTAKYGDHEISVEVVGEPDGETDDTNNRITEDITITGKPELFVDLMELLSGDPVVGQLVELRALVKNGGEEDAKTGYAFKLGDEYLRNGTVTLEAGDNAILSFTWNSTGYDARDHTIMLILDEENEIPEYDESNNTHSLVVTLLAPPEKPDAAVVKLESNPQLIFENEEFFIVALVQNIGGAWLNITAVILVDDTQLHTTALTLEPLESRELNVSARLPAGTHGITLELSDGDVEEESLENNVKTDSVAIISLPELFVLGVYTFDFEELFEGYLLALSGKIVNSGDCDVIISYAFLVDNVSMETGTAQITASTTLTLPFNWTAEGIGTHTISLEIEGLSPTNITSDESSLSLEVLSEILPELTIKTLLIAPASPSEGDTVYITVSVEFDGTIDITVNVFVDGDLLTMKRVEFSEGKTILFQWDQATAGDHELNVELTPSDGGTPVEKSLEFRVKEKDDGEGGEVSGEEAGFLSLEIELPVVAMLICLVIGKRRQLGKRRN